VGGEPIRIDLVRSGGFAGVSLAASLDTGRLPPEEARAVTELVDRVDFAALAARAASPSRVPDAFQYDLTVSRGRERHQLSLGESAVTPELRPLLDRLVASARPA
jgi:hypothetical protein